MPTLTKRRSANQAQTPAPAPAGATAAPPTPLAAGEALLTPSEAAAKVAVSPAVLERWRSAGEGPPFVGFTRKTIRYRAADLDAFVAARVRASTAG